MSSASLDNIRKTIEGMSQEKKLRVYGIVNRHLKACAQYSIVPDNLERILIEAVDVANSEERFPEEKRQSVSGWEPFRRYEQYLAPKENSI